MELITKIPSTVYVVGVERELRILIGEERTVSLELLSGLAEIFGSELVQNTVYRFRPYSCISLFSWSGCRVKVSGKVWKAYVTSNSLIMLSVTIHACLQERRILAEYIKGKGPVSLVVGPARSGKSTFCHFLSNYAARMERNPLYIDLDVSQNRSSMPGTISIFPVKKPSHISEGFSKESLSVYAFGHTHPRKNSPLYVLLIRKLAKMVQKQTGKTNYNMYHSGIIIDTCGWKRKKGYLLITFVAWAFNIDVVFVIDSTHLFTKLKNDMPSYVEVVYVPKQKGIVSHRRKELNEIEANLTWEYFYGSIDNPLTPCKFDVKFSDIQIYSSKSQCRVTDMRKICIDDVKIVCVQIGPELVSSILGLSFADEYHENILVTNVRGFLCVVGVDMDKKFVTVLSPQSGPLPGRILILCSVKLTRMETGV